MKHQTLPFNPIDMRTFPEDEYISPERKLQMLRALPGFPEFEGALRTLIKGNSLPKDADVESVWADPKSAAAQFAADVLYSARCNLYENIVGPKLRGLAQEVADVTLDDQRVDEEDEQLWAQITGCALAAWDPDGLLLLGWDRLVKVDDMVEKINAFLEDPEAAVGTQRQREVLAVVSHEFARAYRGDDLVNETVGQFAAELRAGFIVGSRHFPQQPVKITMEVAHV